MSQICRHIPWSTQNVRGTGDEKTGAAGLAPDALVARSRRTVVVVAGEELALVDPQFSVEEMQLFDARVCMRGVTGAGRKAHEHANPVPFCVRRQQLAFDPRRDLLPFGLGPLSRRRQYRLLPGLLGDATRKASVQGGRRTQHVRGPGDELSDHRAEAFQLALALRTRGDVGFGRSNFAPIQDLQSVGARQLGVVARVQVLAGTHWLMAQSRLVLPTARPQKFRDVARNARFISYKTSNATFWIGSR